VTVPQRKGEPIVVDTDEGVRANTTVESLSGLRPSFAADGTITAGSSSQISDGAAAVVVMSKIKAEGMGWWWMAETGAHGGGVGAVTLCGGGGQGDALIIRVPQA